MENGELKCQDCPAKKGKLYIDEDRFELNLNDDDGSIRVNIDEKGLEIKRED